jgi:GNAT superfamily N-acetyltransferase
VPISATSLAVRPLNSADLPFTAPLHALALPHGLFAQLGVGFLSAYHHAFADSPYAVALVAEEDGFPFGFLLGTFDNDLHYRHAARHHGPALVRRAVGGLRREPHLAWTLVRDRTRRYARRAVQVARPAPPAAGPAAVLHHVAMVPGVRRCGAGADLVEAFLQQATAEGAPRAVTLTRAGHDGAGAFYRRLGWQQVTTEGESDWERYEIDLHR